MGGEIALISSAIGLIGGMTSQKPNVPDQSAALAAQRQAQEEEQRKREADERKRDREKITEARSIEKKRLAANPEGSTTLSNGGAGLLDEPEIAEPRLKTKFGE